MESPRLSRRSAEAAARSTEVADRKLSLPANMGSEVMGSAGESGNNSSSNYCDSSSSLDAVDDIQAALRGHHARYKMSYQCFYRSRHNT